MAEGTATVVSKHFTEPKVGLHYINEHVISLMGSQAFEQDSLKASRKDLEATLVDLKETVGDTKRIADLNDSFCNKALLDLNALLTKVN